MPELNIPERERLGLAILRRMPDDVLNSLLLEIDRSPGSVPAVKNLSPDDADKVMESINSMYRVRALHEVSLEEFTSDICESLREHDELKPNEEPQFRERLARVLDVEALSVAAKAFVLGAEHEHLFCSARIITDARPVYGKNVSEPPAAMIIAHTLKIEYHEAAGKLNEIYLGLGSDDIKELRKVLDRAEEKVRSLRASLGASKIKFIDPQE